ncbi:hypothetical protein DSLASN_26530 [Desulfoluna limicola]|uniref:Uncharacterized protein n=1 Tax=Desulfoluna limicola TaxID=2810562 RepID=A0ABN6F5W3_9BACT|nr:hypothetical protein DSLASN_26530 [Desulfoluna limicola]
MYDGQGIPAESKGGRNVKTLVSVACQEAEYTGKGRLHVEWDIFKVQGFRGRFKDGKTRVEGIRGGNRLGAGQY